MLRYFSIFIILKNHFADFHEEPKYPPRLETSQLVTIFLIRLLTADLTSQRLFSSICTLTALDFLSESQRLSANIIMRLLPFRPPLCFLLNTSCPFIAICRHRRHYARVDLCLVTAQICTEMRRDSGCDRRGGKRYIAATAAAATSPRGTSHYSRPPRRQQES